MAAWQRPTAPAGRPKGPAHPPARWPPAKRAAARFSNRFLLGAIGIALAFATALNYIPALNSIFGIAPLTGTELTTVALFPSSSGEPTNSAACCSATAGPGQR